MAVLFSPFGNDQIVDLNGNPAINYTVETFTTGSSTPLATFTDSTGASPNANPATLNSAGLLSGNNQFWLTQGLAYKFVVKDAGGAVFRTVDGVSGVASAVGAVSQFQASGLTPTYVSTTQFTLSGDQTSAFHVNRRLQFTTTAGIVYGAITATAYTTLTTVTVRMDGLSVLDAGLSAVNLSILTATNTALPYVIAAAGPVLQVVTATDAGFSTTSSAMTNLTGSAPSITPKSSNSKIIVECVFRAAISPLGGSNVDAAFQLYDNISATVIGNAPTIGAANGSGGTGIHVQLTLRWSVTNAALTNRQFSLRGLSGNAGATASATGLFFTFTEVQN